MQEDSKQNPATETSENDEDLEETLEEILAGHSIHGDAFNEGPRQQAYLMGGTGNVRFPVTTNSDEAQAFINQGIGQLHGFWYLEAERSFRHAASLDPDCAMAYWGAAMAAYDNRDRAKGFIEEAVERKDGLTSRESMYIDALEKYFSDDKKDKSKRAQQLLKDFESIVIDFPDDIEAKAFVAHRIWYNGREGIPVSSFIATDSLINEIFESEPLHPSHHYTIHLWDYRKPERALAAAARCGPSAPSIAHMWHMPGHIYSRLKRYEDAVFQQEASARVDHAHMMRDRVMPDEINNFAHNNEWLIRNLIFLGRVNDAIDLAKNMVELPRHPKYNTLSKRNGSASYGRRRLLQVLREYEQHELAIELCNSACLKAEENEEEHIKTLRLLGCASAINGNAEMSLKAHDELSELLTKKSEEKTSLEHRISGLELELNKDKDLPPRPRRKDFDKAKASANLKKAKSDLGKVKQRVKQLEKAILAIDGYAAAANQDYTTAYQNIEKAAAEDVSLVAEWQFCAGESDAAIEKLKKQVSRRPQEVIPLARLAWAYYQNGDTEASHETFEKLRDASTCMDLDIEIFRRLQPIARELSLPDDWRKKYQPPVDIGFRPQLDSLGPFRWSPQAAPQWSLRDSESITVGSKDFAGRPHIVIFYLGHGCLHCAEQLQAFAPKVNDFADAGIDMIAISTDDHDGLLKSISDAGGSEFGIRLTSNGDKSVFKKFRAYDDFEDQPLHGTFLIDGQGKIRWQDIGYEPFMDHEFLLKEAQRLLANETARVKP
ncbi:MAG: redoxin domain-containing protein [Planctomycetota bacterium]